MDPVATPGRCKARHRRAVCRPQRHRHERRHTAATLAVAAAAAAAAGGLANCAPTAVPAPAVRVAAAAEGAVGADATASAPQVTAADAIAAAAHATATAAAASIATAAEHRPDAATARHAIHQPALPLADALREIARQSGHPVVFDAASVTGREAPAIGGWMTVREAVGWVVEGAGLATDALQGGGILVRVGRLGGEPGRAQEGSGRRPTALSEPGRADCASHRRR